MIGRLKARLREDVTIPRWLLIEGAVALAAVILIELHTLLELMAP